MLCLKLVYNINTDITSPLINILICPKVVFFPMEKRENFSKKWVDFGHPNSDYKGQSFTLLTLFSTEQNALFLKF